MSRAVRSLVAVVVLASCGACLSAQTWQVKLNDTLQIAHEGWTQGAPTNVKGYLGSATVYKADLTSVEVRAETVNPRQKSSAGPYSVFGLKVKNPDPNSKPATQLVFSGIGISDTPQSTASSLSECLYPGTSLSFPACMTEFMSPVNGGYHPATGYTMAGIGTCFDGLTFENMAVNEIALASNSPCTQLYIYAKNDCSVPLFADVTANAVKKPITADSRQPLVKRLNEREWLVEIDQQIEILQTGYQMIPSRQGKGRMVCGWYISDGSAYTTPVKISMLFTKLP